MIVRAGIGWCSSQAVAAENTKARPRPIESPDFFDIVAHALRSMQTATPHRRNEC